MRAKPTLSPVSPAEVASDLGGDTRVLGASVELRGLEKRFGPVTVLRGLDAEFDAGRVHALVGENGAGKSTLGRVIAGVHPPSAGELRIDGASVRHGSPRQALARGVTMISQELLLVPRRSVLENVYLGTADDRLPRRALRRRFAQLCAAVGFDLPADAPVGDLRLADQQKVEILRAIARDARLIVMDEPTAALTGVEADRLLDVIRVLRDQGRTVIFVSHFLSQVLDVADTVTVMRDGRIVAQRPAAGETADSLIESMLGRSLNQTFPPPSPVDPDAPVALSVNRVQRVGEASTVSLEVKSGEIVGIAGLVGAGRSEFLRAVFGADRVHAGSIAVYGAPVAIRHPWQAIRAGVAMIPESRKDDGLLLGASVRHNIALPHLTRFTTAGLLRLGRERRATESAARAADVRGAKRGLPVSSLSGGNQQKAMFAKWLLGSPQVLLVDEPSRGVDVGSRQTIYELVRDFAARGGAVLLVSSEIEEVLGLSHRVLVMRGGRIAAEFDAADATEQAVLNAAFGATGQPVPTHDIPHLSQKEETP